MEEFELIERIIRQRRTIQNYLPKKIPEDILFKTLKSALYAPNHKNTFPTKFYILGEMKRRQLANISLLIRHQRGIQISEELKKNVEKKFLDPSHLLIIARKNSENQIQSKEDYATISCVVHNISLILWAKGVGIKWSTGELIKRMETYNSLNIDPKEETIEGLIFIGYPETISLPPAPFDLESSLKWTD
jgi:nitroreductase